MRDTIGGRLRVWRRAASLQAAKRARRPDGACLGAIGEKTPATLFFSKVNESTKSTSQRYGEWSIIPTSRRDNKIDLRTIKYKYEYDTKPMWI